MGEEKRFILFLVLSTLVVILTPQLVQFVWGPPPRPAAAVVDEQPVVPEEGGKEEPDKPDQAKAPEKIKAAQTIEPAEVAAKPVEPLVGIVEEPELESRTLGSTDPQSGHKLKVYLSNLGASVRRIELADYKSDEEGHRSEPLELLTVKEGEDGSFLLGLEGLPTLLERRRWNILGGAEAPADAADSASVRFQTAVPERGLLVTKTYTLKKGSYNIELEIEISSPAGMASDVAYRLGGPRGFVLEGAWYSRKLRDVAIADGYGASLKRHTVNAAALVKGADKILQLDESHRGIGRDKWTLPPEWFDRFDLDKNDRLSGEEVERAAFQLAGGERNRWVERPVRFAGVEGQFFCALLVVPPPPSVQERWDAATAPVLCQRDRLHPDRSDVSMEIASKPFEVRPGEPLRHTYTVYAGPRKRAILEESLNDMAIVQSIIDFQGVLMVFPSWLVGWMATTMLFLLQLFHSWVGNWGVAIIMLTALVRMIMFPLSRKQAMSAVKMQALKPELDALRERHKNEKEKLASAQMELWRKHGVNPMGGCLPVLIQMPIFVGLWQGLSSSVDLRQAPFLWIKNLAAPDGPSIPWFEWGENIPLISHFLGPYFNLLPTILIGLMLVQQKLFMPPKSNPPDPQMEMQQKMMTYMMVFFGCIFWRLPSGLCVYYICSTSWGIVERKLLPKFQHVQATAVVDAENEGREGGGRKGPRGAGPDGKGPRRGGKGPSPSNGNGMTLVERVNEIIKRASKR